MWKIFCRKIKDIGDAYKMAFMIYPRWWATLVCVGCTIINVILIVPNLIYLIWSSWYINRIFKKDEN